MPRALTPETRLKHRVRDLERMVDSWPIAAQHREIWDYLEQLAALSHIALNGIRRPDDLGGSINAGHAESRAPHYHAEAMTQLKAELAHCAARSKTLRGLTGDGGLLSQYDGHRNGNHAA